MFESEERRVAQRIKDFIKNRNPDPVEYIMLRDGQILDINDYNSMINRRKIKPRDAYVYIRIGGDSSKSAFYYPFLNWYLIFLDSYLSKLGFDYGRLTVPATGLKYMAITVDYEKYLAIEVVNLDIAASNTNLRKIVFEALDGKLISGEKVLAFEEYEKIRDMFKSQKLFAGHNVNEAYDIIYDYYNRGDKSLIREVARIVMDYYRIFQSYRACYETETWDEVEC